MLCQSDAPVTIVTGGCKAQARWIGSDGLVRCSLHHIQEFGHGDRLVRIAGYEPPQRRAYNHPSDLPEKLPAQHAKLDALAAEYGIDLGDAESVADKQAVIEAAR